MTDRMIQAGVGAYLLNQYKTPEVLVDAVWEAIGDAKHEECMENYRKACDE